MKQYIFSILISFSFINYTHAQTIKISSGFRNSIEMPGDVLIDGGSIELNNATIICNTITFSSTVKEIRIRGNVKIKRKTIILKKVTDNSSVKFKKSSGILTIEYSEKFDDNDRSFDIEKAGSLQLIFVHKERSGNPL